MKSLSAVAVYTAEELSPPQVRPFSMEMFISLVMGCAIKLMSSEKLK
jgi:hypothetical protein